MNIAISDRFKSGFNWVQEKLSSHRGDSLNVSETDNPSTVRANTLNSSKNPANAQKMRAQLKPDNDIAVGSPAEGPTKFSKLAPAKNKNLSAWQSSITDASVSERLAHWGVPFSPENVGIVTQAFKTMIDEVGQYPEFYDLMNASGRNKYQLGNDKNSVLERMQTHREWLSLTDIDTEGKTELLRQGPLSRMTDQCSTMFVKTIKMNGENYHAVFEGNQPARAHAFLSNPKNSKLDRARSIFSGFKTNKPTKVIWSLELIKESDYKNAPPRER